MEKSSNYLDLFSLLFMSLGILAILNSFFIFKTPSQVLWLCYICLIIIGIGVLRRDGSLIASQINVLFIPLILWNVDFFYNVITRTPLLGITDYFFTPGIDLGKVISLQHLITIPLAIYCLYKIGLKKNNAWKISLIQVTLFYFLTRLFTSPEQNLNCAFRPCANIPFFQLYPLVWFLAFFIVICLTTTLLNKIFLKKK